MCNEYIKTRMPRAKSRFVNMFDKHYLMELSDDEWMRRKDEQFVLLNDVHT